MKYSKCKENRLEKKSHQPFKSLSKEESANKSG